MRKFKLINSEGVELDISRDEMSLENPDGLGFDRDLAYVRAGTDFIETDDNPIQKNPKGEMVFQSYEDYAEFAAFIAKTPLKLCYKPLSEWHYLDCKVHSLAKGEMQDGGLYCDIDFLGSSTWYQSTKIGRTQNDSSLGKKYSYTYSYYYVDTARGTIIVQNDKSLPAPCKLHIYGPCVNPSWSLVQGGTVIVTGKVTASFSETEKLVIDSNIRTMEIAKRGLNNELIADEYQNSDFSTERFIFAPPGESTLSFSHEGSEILNAVVEVQTLADTV